MSGFLEATGAMIAGIFGAILMIVLVLAGMLVGVLAMGLVWIDVVLINVWVVLDRVLGSLLFMPAPVSWALLSGALGFLVRLGCSARRR